MQTCRACARHLIHAEPTCPFCGAAQPSALLRTLKRVSGGAMAVLTPMVLAACYGAPPKNLVQEDADDDSYPVTEDCDDDNPDIHPDADEDCTDTIDNNCDELVDGEAKQFLTSF